MTDFSKGKRGRIVPLQPEAAGMTRVILWLNEDVLEYFMAKADKAGGAIGYSDLINDVLRKFMEEKLNADQSA